MLALFVIDIFLNVSLSKIRKWLKNKNKAINNELRTKMIIEIKSLPSETTKKMRRPNARTM